MNLCCQIHPKVKCVWCGDTRCNSCGPEISRCRGNATYRGPIHRFVLARTAMVDWWPLIWTEKSGWTL